MNELKSCPFCGGIGEIKIKKVGEVGAFGSKRDKLIWVQCVYCDAQTKAFLDSTGYSAVDKATEAWNRRASDGSSQQNRS